MLIGSVRGIECYIRLDGNNLPSIKHSILSQATSIYQCQGVQCSIARALDCPNIPRAVVHEAKELEDEASFIFFFFLEWVFPQSTAWMHCDRGEFGSKLSKFSYFTASCLDRSISLTFCWDLLNSICSKEHEWKRRSATTSFVIVFLPVSQLLWLPSDAW